MPASFGFPSPFYSSPVRYLPPPYGVFIFNKPYRRELHNNQSGYTNGSPREGQKQKLPRTFVNVLGFAHQIFGNPPSRRRYIFDLKELRVTSG